MATSSQGNRQRIQQPLGHSQVLALAPLLTAQADGIGRTLGPAGQG